MRALSNCRERVSKNDCDGYVIDAFFLHPHRSTVLGIKVESRSIGWGCRIALLFGFGLFDPDCVGVQNLLAQLIHPVTRRSPKLAAQEAALIPPEGEVAVTLVSRFEPGGMARMRQQMFMPIHIWNQRSQIGQAALERLAAPGLATLEG